MKHPSLRWIAAFVVLLALVGLGWRGYQARQAAQQAQMAPAPTPAIELRDIDVARATLENLNLTLPISGTLHAVRSAVVKARVPGELQGLTVREGDHVQAGQVLARVEPVEYAERLRQAMRGIDVVTGRHLAVGPVDDFPSMIRRLVNSPAEAATMAAAARELVEERYDWRILGSTLLDALSEILVPAPGAGREAGPRRAPA